MIKKIHQIECKAAGVVMAIPKNSLNKDQLKHLERLHGSGNEVYKAKVDGELVFYKAINEHYTVELAEWEVAISAVARLFLKDRAAKVELVYQDGKVAGVCSYAIDGFKDMNHVDNRELDKDQLLSKKFVSALFFLYFFMQDDAHPGNLCTNHLGEAAIFDYDMFMYPETVKIKGARVVSQIGLASSAEQAFDIIAKDLVTFPVCTAFNPCFWPCYTTLPANFNINKVFSNAQAFVDLAKLEQTQDDVFISALQVLIVEPMNLESAMHKVISNRQIIDTMLKVFVERRHLVQEQLKLSDTYAARLNKSEIPSLRVFVNLLSNDLDQTELQKNHLKLCIQPFVAAIYAEIESLETLSQPTFVFDSLDELVMMTTHEEDCCQAIDEGINAMIAAYRDFVDAESPREAYLDFEHSMYIALTTMMTTVEAKQCEEIWLQVQEMRKVVCEENTANTTLSPLDPLQDDHADFLKSAVVVNEVKNSNVEEHSIEQSSLYETIASEIYNYLSNLDKKEEVLAALIRAKKAYQPSTLRVISGASRESVLGELLDSLSDSIVQAKQLVEFCSNGGWGLGNVGMFYSESTSLNVLIIREIGLSALKNFQQSPDLEFYNTDAHVRNLVKYLHQGGQSAHEKLSSYLMQHAKAIYDEMESLDNLIYSKQAWSLQVDLDEGFNVIEDYSQNCSFS